MDGVKVGGTSILRLKHLSALQTLGDSRFELDNYVDRI